MATLNVTYGGEPNLSGDNRPKLVLLNVSDVSSITVWDNNAVAFIALAEDPHADANEYLFVYMTESSYVDGLYTAQITSLSADVEKALLAIKSDLDQECSFATVRLDGGAETSGSSAFATEVSAAVQAFVQQDSSALEVVPVPPDLTFVIGARASGDLALNKIGMYPGNEEMVSFDFRSRLEQGGDYVLSVESVVVSGSGVSVKAGTDDKYNSFEAKPTLTISDSASAGERTVTATVISKSGRTIVGKGIVKVN